MASLAIMKSTAKPSSKSSFTVRTAPDLLSNLNLAVVRMANNGLEFQDRKLGKEAFVAAAMLNFLKKTDAEIREVLEQSLPELERLFEAAGTIMSPTEEGVGIKVVKAGPTRGKRAPKKKDESA